MNKLLLVLCAVVLFASCAPRPYVAANMYQSTSKHKVVAILPPRVNIQLRPRQMRNTTPEQLRDMEERTAGNIQQAMFSWLLRKQDRLNYSVRFQDVTTTQAKLKSANIDYVTLRTMEPQEIAKILSVDGIIDMDINTDKPMSEGAAIVMAALFGMYAGSTNHTTVITNIHDGSSGTLLWKMTQQANGGAGSSPEQLVRTVMKTAARRFPYRKTKVDAAGHARNKYAD